MMNCPHCSEDVGTPEFLFQLAENSSMQFVIRPKAGERLSAKAVGGVISQFEVMMKAIGRDAGIKTFVCVDNISTHEDGSIEIKFVIARIAKGLSK